MPTAEVGLFSLEEVIGEGGIAQVYRGHHRTQGVPVAVKVVTADRARHEAFRSTFEIEVQAMARLDHPAVARVLDYGEVPRSAQVESGGELRAGSPYLVMELASQGSLERLSFPLPWQTTHGIMATLLDALAHAHARNVVHRDLKPANILLAGAEDLRPGLKITDFGIAQAMGDETGQTTLEAMASVGTPNYMAPEQLFGEWRDQGPWTDLYALGCVAYQLSTGKLPFRGKSMMSIARAHLQDPVGEFELPSGYPPAFGDWIRRALEKDPSKRYQRAADAAHALRAWVGEPKALGTALSLGSGSMASEAPTILNTTPMTTLEFGPASLSDTSEAPLDLAADVPPLPPTWQAVEAPPSVQLLGAGIALFGLRTLPMVDRSEERDALWSALRRVCTEREPRFVLLKGAAGVGKSRVQDWVAQRADEVGGAFVFRVGFGQSGDSTESLIRAVARFFRVQGLSGRELTERMSSHFERLQIADEHGRQALVDALEPPRAQQTGGIGQDLRARQRALLWLLSRLSRVRPVLITFDDLQWGLDGIRFIELALNQAPGRPLFMMGTAREESLNERPAEDEALQDLVQHARAQVLDIPRLDAADHRALVGRMLGLEHGLADRVAERTGGNPLFAIQLVSDWVERSALVLGSRGFVLSKDDPGLLPDDLSDLCAARIKTAISDRRTDRQLLELAALLGERVSYTEWKEAAAELGLKPGRELTRALVRSQLAIMTRDGWRFSHGVIQESLVQRATASPDHLRYRDAIVAMLTRLYGVQAFGVSERIGRHLMAAGQSHAAVSRLLQGARDRHQRSDLEGLFDVTKQVREALARSGAPHSDRRYGELEVLEVKARIDQGRFTSAAHHAASLTERARNLRDPELAAEAVILRAMIAHGQGDSEAAVRRFAEASQRAEQGGFDGLRLRAMLGMAEALYRMGDLGRAQSLYRDALPMASQLQDPVGQAEVHWGLGYIALWQGNLGLARTHFEAQRRLFAQCGNRLGLGRCLNALGEVERLLGNLDEAERLYRSSIHVQTVIGASGVVPSRLNLSLVLMSKREFQESHRVIQRVLEEHRLERNYRCCALAQRMCSRADAQDWEGFDLDADECLRLVDALKLVDGDLAWTLQMAGDVALAQDSRARARRAYRAALSQWEALGRTDKVAEVETGLSTV